MMTKPAQDIANNVPVDTVGSADNSGLPLRAQCGRHSGLCQLHEPHPCQSAVADRQHRLRSWLLPPAGAGRPRTGLADPKPGGVCVPRCAACRRVGAQRKSHLALSLVWRVSEPDTDDDTPELGLACVRCTWLILPHIEKLTTKKTANRTYTASVLFNNTPTEILPDTTAERAIGDYVRGAWAVFAKDPLRGWTLMGAAGLGIPPTGRHSSASPSTTLQERMLELGVSTTSLVARFQR